ncbi:MAG: carbamoyltransferase C-terminal domain-containing protein [Bacteroidota bacterium]
MKTIMGISCLGHDAGVAIVKGKEICFAAQTERYSKQKNDSYLNHEIIQNAIDVGGSPDLIVYYENPLQKKLRQLVAGQWKSAFFGTWPKRYIRSFTSLSDVPIHSVGHHLSHAAGGYYTSSFKEAAIIVVDAIGEWNTITVWEARGNDLKKIYTCNYPNSLGLFYSAFTQRIGYKPNEEEYIMMGLATLGEPKYAELIKNDFIEDTDPPNFELKRSMHRGILDWRPDLKDDKNIAASVQQITEDFLIDLWKWTSQNTGMTNLVYSGGVALNCVANAKLVQKGFFENVWIMPNPGDSGSSLGAALAYKNDWVNWNGPYLGYNLDRPFLQENEALEELMKTGIIGFAHGRSEFGPRALGNRSLLANPTIPDIKDRVNHIKKRQSFRPFAPIVLEEHAHEYFDLPFDTSPYMQYVVRCKKPNSFPGIVHSDGSSRVQTINSEQNNRVYNLLKSFYQKTGCPMMLNTSLNIKGMPILNDQNDILAFEKKYHIKVF